MKGEFNTNPKYTAVVCPQCGSKNIEFVTEYHKCILARILSALFFVMAIIAAYFEITDLISNFESNGVSTFTLILSVFAYFITQCYIVFVESKTHVQGVCRDCGNIWLIN